MSSDHNFSRACLSVLLVGGVAAFLASGCDAGCPNHTGRDGDVCRPLGPVDGADAGAKDRDAAASSSNNGKPGVSNADGGSKPAGSAGTVATGTSSNPIQSAGGTAASSMTNGSSVGTGGTTGTSSAPTGTPAGSGGTAATPPPTAGTSSAAGADASPPTCTPAAEQCDNLDNDCDGQIDEEVTRPCGISVGPCQQGTLACHAGQWDDDATQCRGAIGPKEEVCDAAMVDENCNGVSNEQCACTEGMKMACGTNAPPCKQGTLTCTNGTWPTVCQGEVKGSAEVCDGVDNDCDGTVDKGGDALCSGGKHCAGSKACVECVQDSECKPTGACTTATCSAGTCKPGNQTAGTKCSASGGKVCDGAGECVGCNTAADCPAAPECNEATCSSHACGTKPIMAGTSCGASKTCSATGTCVTLGVCGDGKLDPGTEECDYAAVKFCDRQCHFVYRACTKDADCPEEATCFNSKFCAPRCTGSSASCAVAGAESGDGFCYNGAWCLRLCKTGCADGTCEGDGICPSGSTCTPVSGGNISACF